MARIRVIYLARAVNGLAPFERFLASYRKYSSGLEHDFSVVLKGFKTESELAPYESLVRSVNAAPLRVADYGFDLRAYLKAVERFGNPEFCFFNSFAELLAERWLEKLSSALNQPGAGLAGATASCESMYTNVLIQREQFPSRSFIKRLWTPIRLILCKACFNPFPNCHLRTNGILISRDIFLKVWPRWVLTKRSAYLFENGKRSLTNRVLALNREVLLVGKDGRIFKRADWPRSGTFRLGDQSNLLVADNQTRQYAEADLETRNYLARVAWGTTKA